MVDVVAVALGVGVGAAAAAAVVVVVVVFVAVVVAVVVVVVVGVVAAVVVCCCWLRVYDFACRGATINDALPMLFGCRVAGRQPNVFEPKPYGFGFLCL